MTAADALDPAPSQYRSERSANFARRLQVAGIETGKLRSSRFQKADNANDDRLELLRIMPAWIGWPKEAQDKLAQAVAILSCRSAIDLEISGPRLTSFAEIMGDDLFESLCDLELDEEDQSPLSHLLPRPDMLVHLGRKLLAAGLPPMAAGQFAGAAGNVPAARLAAIAAPLVQRRREQDAMEGAPV
ncbi:hypothetical protein ACFOWX_11710 [Sphingorhabdus arenilitoris]|uniref:Uncharacterized protein n=1 Tax=Sphingorhabdus arenilitoris TaxID=1490041 RepID=A0ABV8RLC2_9SPHN